MTIARFVGPFRFLSNFYPFVITLDGVDFPTVEHAYQAAKTLSNDWREKIRRAPSPSEARRIGRMAPIRADWEENKLQIMEVILRCKFAPGSDLAKRLAFTKGEELVEGNTWRDTYWGVCEGKGYNHLGKILMKIRGELP